MSSIFSGSCRMRAAILLVSLAVAGCSSSSPEDLLADARKAMARNDYSEAAIQLKNALQASPDFAPARLELGRIALEQRDYLSAEKELNRARELGVADDEVVPLLARALLELGRAPDVASRFSSTRLNSPEAQAKLDAILGYAALAASDQADAQRRFESALAVNPQDVTALTGKARLLTVNKQFEAGSELIKPLLQPEAKAPEAWLLEAEIRAARGDQAGMIEALREVYRMRPDHLRARSTVIGSLIGAGKYEEASRELDAMRKVAPSAGENDYLKGLLLVSQGKYAEARPSVEKVLAKAPDYLPAVWLSAMINYKLKAYAQAEQQAEKLVAKGAGAMPVRKLLISSYLGGGRIAKAQQALEPLLKASPNDPEVLAIAAQVQLAAGDSDTALKSLEKSAKAQPESQIAQTRLGMTKLATGDYAGGVEALERAARIDDDTRPDMLLALAHLRQQKGDAALEALDALEAKKPGEPGVQNLRGVAHLLKRDEAAARAAFEAALRIQPTFLPAASNLARLDIAAKKPEAAVKRFESILAHDPRHPDALMALAALKAQSVDGRADAEKLLTKAVKEHPELLKARVALVQLYSATGSREKALQAAQAAMTANPDDAGAVDLLAQVQASQGDLAAAVGTLSNAVEKNPNDAGVRAKLAAAQAAAGRHSEAEQNFKKALQMKPDAPEIELMLAALYRSQKSFDDALRIAKGLQKRYPASSAGYLVEGDVMVATSKRSDAAEAFHKAYEREPGADVLIRLLSMLDSSDKEPAARKLAAEWMEKHPRDTVVPMYEAGSAMARNQFDRARTEYQRVLRVSPDNAIVLNNLAWLSWRTKDAEAKRFAEKAYGLAPDNPAVLDTYGVILVESGQMKKGLEMLGKAVEKAPQSDAIVLNYARALVQNNQKSEARPYLEKLAALGNKFAGATEAANLLKSL